jgi:hypothetical protein
MHFWELFQWWNLIFTLPFGIGLLPLLLQAAGVMHSGHSGHDALAHSPHHAASHITHHPTHAPAAHGHDTAVSGHAHSGHADSGPHDHSAPPRISFRWLSFLGIGKVPIMLILSIFCLLWGTTGVIANQIFSQALRVPAIYIWPSLCCALIVSYFTTGALSQRISRIVPEVASYGTDEQSLVGRSARAAYELSAKTGSAFLLDDQQNRIQVRCRTHDGSVIPRGAEVLLLEYDAQSRVFTVVRMQRESLSARDSSPSEPPALPRPKIKLQQ